MKTVSARTRAIIQRMFPSGQQNDAEQFLIEECGTNLPMFENADEARLERIRFAVLKLSGGDLDELLRSIQSAQTDWRDTLMAADFGMDVTAHNHWADSYLSAHE